MFLADQWQDYEVLDCGGGEKLERWGDVYLRRPDPQAIWPARDPSLWRKAQALVLMVPLRWPLVKAVLLRSLSPRNPILWWRSWQQYARTS